MDKLTESIVTIIVGITGLAILAVIVSNRSNTAGVLGAFFGGYSQAISAAVSPVTGGGGYGSNTLGRFSTGQYIG